MLTDEDIDRPRTPSELREFIRGVTEHVLADEEATARGIRKEGVFKRYFDEILPLSIFVDLEYSDDYLIQPVRGSQGYDANVVDLNGNLVERIEITSPHDGYAENADAELLLERGYGEPSSFGDSAGQVEQLKPYVHAAAVQKSRRDYSDSVLVIVVNLVNLPPELRANQDEAIQDLADELRALTFNARRVRLVVPPDRVVPIAG